jgi:hypothetical protein
MDGWTLRTLVKGSLGSISVDRIDTRFEPIGPSSRHASIDYTAYYYHSEVPGLASGYFRGASSCRRTSVNASTPAPFYLYLPSCRLDHYKQ